MQLSWNILAVNYLFSRQNEQIGLLAKILFKLQQPLGPLHYTTAQRETFG